MSDRECIDVVVPAVVLAELYRGQGHDQTVDAYLSRDAEVLVHDTDRSFARLVGSVLTAARTGSKDIVDAHVVASAVKVGGGVVLTGDRKDLKRLAVPYPHVHISAI